MLILKTCFDPVTDNTTRVLILGSLPGEASLKVGQYYAHPHNQFWSLLQILIQQSLVNLSYPEKLAVLQKNGIGLWDVIGKAQRKGSLDANIRSQSDNDLTALACSLPELKAVAFNGTTAARAAKQLKNLAYDIILLPSSSPAYTLPFDKKLNAWRAISGYLTGVGI